jgi:hypothetical protein
VWHEGLLYKLKKIGVTGNLLHWFTDYLNDRKQRVIIKGECSSWGDIKAGVPQGSVLGPLLFLIYINDLENVVSCNLKMFADDTCLYVTTDDSALSANTLNDNLTNIKLWADQWLVNFNPSKTKSMVISYKKANLPPLYFDGNLVAEVQQHKHLGVILNNRLTWNNHISNIVKNVSSVLDVMHKLAKDMDRESLETFYKTFVRPKLEYAAVIWDDCSDQDSKLLENCQLRAARIVTGAKRGTHHQYIYDELKWLTLKDRREYFKLCFMHKIVHHTAPDYLVEILPNTVNADTNYHLRNREDLQQFSFRTEKFRKSLFPDCIRKWNSLDSNIRHQASIVTFKTIIDVTEKSCPLLYLGTRK